MVMLQSIPHGSHMLKSKPGGEAAVEPRGRGYFSWNSLEHPVTVTAFETLASACLNMQDTGSLV